MNIENKNSLYKNFSKKEIFIIKNLLTKHPKKFQFSLMILKKSFIVYFLYQTESEIKLREDQEALKIAKIICIIEYLSM